MMAFKKFVDSIRIAEYTIGCLGLGVTHCSETLQGSDWESQSENLLRLSIPWLQQEFAKKHQCN